MKFIKNLILILILFLGFSMPVTFCAENVDEYSVDNEQNISSQSKNDEIISKMKKIKQKENQKKASKKQSDETIANSDINIESDFMEYFPERKEVEATGKAKITMTENNTRLYADRIIYNHDANKINAYDNVRIIKDGQVIDGDYIEVDLNYGNALISKPVTQSYQCKIIAKEGRLLTDSIESYQGIATVKADKEVQLSSTGFNSYAPLVHEIGEKTYYKREEKVPVYKIKTKILVVDRYNDHDNITLKNADIYAGNTKLGRASIIKLVTDKDQDYFESNIPEFGTKQNLGMFFGPGYVFNGPYASTMKIAPLLTYSGGLGVGALGRFQNAKNKTEVIYGSSENKFLITGEHSITDNLKLSYSHNTYTNDWFLGGRISRYAAQLIYQKMYQLEDTDMTFENYFSAGYVTERDSNWGTTRFKWMTQTRKPLVRYENKNETFDFEGGLVGQTSMALYGQGGSMGIARVGPYIKTRYRGWTQDLTYFQTATAGDTPMLFDKYHYGKCNLRLIESIRINKYLALGYYTSIALLKDFPTGNLFQENFFMVTLGPEYAKLSLGYDAFRQSTVVRYSLLVGTDGSRIKYDKAIVKDPNKSQNNKPKFFDKKPKKEKLIETI